MRDGRAALAAGRGDGLIDIRTIDTGDGQFHPGDVYVTTGVGGIYTPGVPVAIGLAKGTDAAPRARLTRADALRRRLASRQYFSRCRRPPLRRPPPRGPRGGTP
ncbi:hypothetical protein AB5I41_29400 [Sphingomonas sp. MMS24-JH45]